MRSQRITPLPWLITLLLATGCSESPSGPPPIPNTLTIENGPTEVRQGDVVSYRARGWDEAGRPIDGGAFLWRVTPWNAGTIGDDGRFVGYLPGLAVLTVSSGDLEDSVTVTITERGLSGSLSVVGRGWQIGPWNTDLWVHGNYAYTGTMIDGSEAGNRLLVWDVSTPASPTRVGEVTIDAKVVNDIKVRSDGALAVITHEGALDQLNGITLLGLADPANPVVLRRYTDGMASGVHNVWIDGQYLYAAVNDAGGLHIIDIANPVVPRTVATFHAGTSFIHDVYVRDGLAFVSHWSAGLIILDVGHGIRGGSPANPVEVSRIVIPGVRVHNAWYWPAGGHVFVGDEVWRPGTMHVVDVRDLRDPIKVAEFETEVGTPHNFWVDESKEILWLAWYREGLRALDASGDLFGRLDRQGRQIAQLKYAMGDIGCFDRFQRSTCTWAPQLHNGLLYLSDVNSGLYVIQPDF